MSEVTQSQNHAIEKGRVELQFSRAARRYDKYANVQQRMAEKLFQWWVADNLTCSEPVRRLIDLGCGTGSLLARIESHDPKGWELHGLDLAAGMVQTAGERTAAQLVCSDLESTPFSGQMFEVALSNATMQWCNSSVAFAEVSRILKPQGVFCFSTLGPETLCEWRDALEAIGMDPSRVHRFSDSAAIESALASQGFQVLDQQRALLVDAYPDASALVRSVRAIGASNASSLSNDAYFGRTQYRRFLDALESRADGNGCSATYDAMWFRCRLNG
ncbi:MAG: methyltransferase domain-containing protein [Planctomycetota bacterium]